VGTVVHMVLLCAGALLGEVWCIWCYCDGSNIGGIVFYMLLLRG
jgi:hypothetical protein